MREQLIEAISSGMRGKWTHIDPFDALTGLNPSNARKRPNNVSHSCWELLHHIVIWQNALIKHIEGEILDWNEIEEKDNWPSIESISDDRNFINLIDEFKLGLQKAENLLKSLNLVNISRGFPKLTIIKLYITLLQHTSYHLGQIITTRQCLGDIPPRNE